MFKPSFKQESARSFPEQKGLKYRADIDGLRAVAVLSVVFFHADWPLFKGGFVGVDIFFVISGFLISTILLNALHSGHFSLSHFYERRIRRILPALYAVCLFTASIASILFLPDDLEKYGRSLTGALLFVSNIIFWRETGYFDISANFKPLLHTWSLAVEEQYYIFFPIFLFLIYKYFQRRYAFFIVLTAAISFALSIWGLSSYPTATFYLAPTRAWELLLGAFLALKRLPAPKSRLLNEGLSGAGAFLIGYAVFFFDYATPFPGPAALIPCLGATMIIYANTGTKTGISKALSWKPMVGIGLISYSLYLWHWPLLVFGRYASTEPLSPGMNLGLVVLSFFVACISWRYIEQPFRKPSRVLTFPFLMRTAGAGSIALLAIAGLFAATEGMPSRFADIHKLESYRNKHEFVEASCVDKRSDQLGDRLCRFGDPDAPATAFLIWGDSHAHSITPAIALAARKHHLAGTLRSYSGCPPLLGVKDIRLKDAVECPAVNNAVLDNIASGQVVFLVARWPYYASRSLVNKEGPAWLVDEETTRISEEENLRILRRGLNRTITALQDKGAYPVLVSSPPEFYKSVPEVVYRFNELPVTPRTLVEDSRADVETMLENVSAVLQIPHLQTYTAFCNESHCQAGTGNTLYFRDSNHLSVDGARKIVDLFVPVFGEAKRTASPALQSPS